MSVNELIEEERKAIRMVEDARAKSEKIISEARERARETVSKVTKREFLDARLKEEEESAQVDAEAIEKMYQADTAKIRQVPEEQIQRAVSFVLREVLKTE